MLRPVRKILRALFNADPAFYDMYADKPTRAAGEEYLEHITSHLSGRFGRAKLDILDAGCQAGRLLIPLARAGHRMIGVDTSGFSLRRADRHARASGLNLTLHRCSIAQLPRRVPLASMDAVISTEVLYLCPDYKALLKILADSVKTGGLVFISHRPPVYYLARAFQQGNPDLAREVLNRSEGPSPEGRYHNWQDPQELPELYRACGLKLVECVPVSHTDIRLKDRFTYRIPSYMLVTAQK